MKCIHFFLCYRWYDLIAAGKKDEEYRDIKWIKKVCFFGNLKCCRICGQSYVACHDRVPTKFTHVVFHRGYSSEVLKFRILNVRVGFGNPQLGAPKDKRVLIIKFLNQK